MKKFTNVVLIIAMVCAIAGVIICGAGIATGGTFGQIKEMITDGKFSWHGWDGWSWDWGWGDDKISLTDGDKMEYTALDITELDVDINAGTLEIQENEENSDKVRVEVYTKNGEVKTGLDNGKLSIQDKTKLVIGNSSVKIMLYLPKNMSFEDVDINVDAGEVISDYDSIRAETVKLDVDAGHMELSKIEAADTLKVTVGAGEIVLDDVTAVDTNLDSGVGRIELTGVLTGDVEADCGVGELIMNLSGAEEDYDYKVDCGVGNVTLGSIDFSGINGTKEIDNGAGRDMKLDCGVGSIEVNYK